MFVHFDVYHVMSAHYSPSKLIVARTSELILSVRLIRLEVNWKPMGGGRQNVIVLCVCVSLTIPLRLVCVVFGDLGTWIDWAHR